MFLKYDVQFKSELPGTAMWEQILKIYELDKLGLLRQVYDTQTSRFNPVKMSLAAHVISHAVAASIYILCSRNVLGLLQSDLK
jgi:hypothetical protein